MNTVTLELISSGLITIITGSIFLFRMLQQMAPREKHKWLLGIGLGSGIITFSLKVILIVSFDSFPKEIIIAADCRHSKIDSIRVGNRKKYQFFSLCQLDNTSAIGHIIFMYLPLFLR